MSTTLNSQLYVDDKHGNLFDKTTRMYEEIYCMNIVRCGITLPYPAVN